MYSYRVEEVEYDAAQIADAHSVDDPCQYSAADRQFPPGCTRESARSLLSLESRSMCAPVQYPPRSAIRSYATLPNIVAPKPCSVLEPSGKASKAAIPSRSGVSGGNLVVVRQAFANHSKILMPRGAGVGSQVGRTRDCLQELQHP